MEYYSANYVINFGVVEKTLEAGNWRLGIPLQRILKQRILLLKFSCWKLFACSTQHSASQPLSTHCLQVLMRGTDRICDSF